MEVRGRKLEYSGFQPLLTLFRLVRVTISAINFSEESNIEYRTRNNESRRIIEHLILKNAEEVLPSELFVLKGG